MRLCPASSSTLASNWRLISRSHFHTYDGLWRELIPLTDTWDSRWQVTFWSEICLPPVSGRLSPCWWSIRDVQLHSGCVSVQSLSGWLRSFLQASIVVKQVDERERKVMELQVNVASMNSTMRRSEDEKSLQMSAQSKKWEEFRQLAENMRLLSSSMAITSVTAGSSQPWSPLPSHDPHYQLMIPIIISWSHYHHYHVNVPITIPWSPLSCQCPHYHPMIPNYHVNIPITISWSNYNATIPITIPWSPLSCQYPHYYPMIPITISWSQLPSHYHATIPITIPSS